MSDDIDDVEQVWRDFWTPIFDKARDEADGSDLMDAEFSRAELEQVKRELYDFKQAMDVVPVVYSHATGGALSKITYSDASQITAAIDEHYSEAFKSDAADAIVRSTAVIARDPDRAVQARIDEVVEAVLQEVQDFLGVAGEDLERAAKDWERVKAWMASEMVQNGVDRRRGRA